MARTRLLNDFDGSRSKGGGGIPAPDASLARDDDGMTPGYQRQTRGAVPWDGGDGLGGSNVIAQDSVFFAGDTVEVFLDDLFPPRQPVSATHGLRNCGRSAHRHFHSCFHTWTRVCIWRGPKMVVDEAAIADTQPRRNSRWIVGLSPAVPLMMVLEKGENRWLSHPKPASSKNRIACHRSWKASG